MKRMLSTLAAVLAVGLVAVVAAGAKSTDTRLTGAGSSFVSPLVSLWAADYASKTGTQIAPWVIVEANDKLHARLKVLKEVTRALEKGLR